MPRPSEAAIHALCESLEVDEYFLVACLEESVIDVYEVEGHLELANGTALRLRRMQRICLTFNVDVSVALMMVK